MPSKTYLTVIIKDVKGSSITAIDVPFDPKEAFGRVRAPVIVKVGKHSYRSTISSMGGRWWIPLRKSNREAAGVEGGQRVKVTLTLDESPRVVEVPADLKRALKAAAAWDAWQEMAFTQQREYAEALSEAKKLETRVRRIAGCVAAMTERAAAAGPKSRKPKPKARATRK